MPSLKKNAFWITVVTFASKILGFVREMLLARFFGTSYIVDAYLMAIAIPSILFGGISTSTSVTYIAVYTEIDEKQGKKASNNFTSNMLIISFFLSLILTTIGLLFTEEIVRLLASGFKGEAYFLTVKFLRISFFALVAITIRNIFMSFLHCNNGYIIEKISSLTFNFVNIAIVIISGLYNYKFLMYGYTFGYFIFMIMTLINSSAKGYKFRIKFDIDKNVKKVFYLSLPVFIGSMANQINLLVDKTIASNLKEGSISALNYAHVVNSFVFNLMTIAVITIVYPYFSKQISKNDMTGFKNTLTKGINLLIIFLMPALIGSVVLAKPTIVFLYERGAFSSSATNMTYTAFIFYSIGIMGMGLKGLMIRAFYSLQNTKIPMIIGLISVGINVTLNFILVRFMEHNGLALATSISATVTVLPLAILLRKKIGSFALMDSMKLFLKSSFSAILMGGAVYLLYGFLSSVIGIGFVKELVSLCIAVLLGALVYFSIMKLLKVKELKYLKSLIV